MGLVFVPFRRMLSISKCCTDFILSENNLKSKDYCKTNLEFILMIKKSIIEYLTSGFMLSFLLLFFIFFFSEFVTIDICANFSSPWCHSSQLPSFLCVHL